MIVAIIGSRSNTMAIPPEWIPRDTTQIISGGAVGIDRMARAFAFEHGILIHEILPDYKQYGRKAPLMRNNEIIDRADLVIAVWNGKSRGTKYVIERCEKLGKPLKIYGAAAD